MSLGETYLAKFVFLACYMRINITKLSKKIGLNDSPPTEKGWNEEIPFNLRMRYSFVE